MLRLRLTLTLMGLLFVGPVWGGEEELGLDLADLLDAKISSAAKYEQTTREAAASVTIVSSDDIEAFGYRTLDEVFRSVPGFYSSNDRNYSYLGARGFSRPTDENKRVLLMINGHAVNDNVWGSALSGDEFALRMNMVDRIEFVRGPGSALYGTSAMLAVINVITKKGNSVDGLQVSAQVGSYGNREASALAGKVLENGTDVLLAASWTDANGQDLYFEEYDDAETNFGVAEGLDWVQHYNLFGSLAYGDLAIQGSWTSREKGIPTGAYEVIFNDPATRSLDEAGFVEASIDRRISTNTGIVIRGHVNHYHYAGSWPYDPTFLDESSGTWVGGEALVLWDYRAHSRLTVGTEVKVDARARYKAWDQDGTYFDQDASSRVLSFFAQEEYQAARNLSFIAGLRMDRTSHKMSSVSPRAAAVYSPIPTGSLKFLYAEAFRKPGIYESHYEDTFQFKPNPELHSERIRTLEAVWEQRIGRSVNANVSLYRYRMKDLIDQTIDPSDDMIQHQNVSEVEARGLEMGLRFQMESGIRGYASYVFQHAKVPGAANRLSNSPLHTAKAGWVFPLQNQIRWAGEFLYESGRRTVYDAVTDSYLITNFRVSYAPTLRSAQTPVSFSFKLNNAFDRSYSTPGGFEHLQAAIRQNGRNYTVEMTVLF